MRVPVDVFPLVSLLGWLFAFFIGILIFLNIYLCICEIDYLINFRGFSIMSKELDLEYSMNRTTSSMALSIVYAPSPLPEGDYERGSHTVGHQG